jgi:conjugal transfer pilus assembly protein TraL
MSSQDLSHVIPNRLDDAGKFLFWERDVAFIALLGILLGISTGFPVTGFLFGWALAFAYSQFKGRKHPGMATHLMYWFTGFPPFKELPASHLRELNG